jgi:hypothetical protein
MHGGGVGITVRQSIQQVRYAKPWQQALFTAGLLIAGAALLALGVIVGLLPALLGIASVRPTIRSIRGSLAPPHKDSGK